MKRSIRDYFSNNYLPFYEKYLQGIRKAGNVEYKTHCPFQGHDDKNASFFFNSETGQYFCHGCGKKGDAFHFYGKINGLNTGRDFGKILKGISDDFGIPWKDRPKAKMVKTYDYTDLAGNLLYQVCRMEPKDFRQRRPDGNGKWIWNLKGVERLLYHLPEVSKAFEVIIVEGEKDAGTLAGLGFVATTCPMGAKKWRPEYSDCLAGKNIVLCPDNDNEGREHMAQVGASLDGNVKSLKLLELHGLPSKGDVTDWVSMFQDPDEASERLAVMIENAPPYEPPKPATHEDALYEIDDFARIELPEKRTLITPWLNEAGIVLVSGWRGVGKSWFALSLLNAIARGEPFGPWETGNPITSLYVDGEMAAQDVQERVTSLSYEQPKGSPLYVYSDAIANSLSLPRINLLNETSRSIIKRILTTHKVKLWICDNLASLTPGIDENSQRDWAPINDWLLQLRFAGIATVLLHHVGKEGSQRGTSSREDNIDCSIKLKHPSDYASEDGCRFVVHFSKARVKTADLALIADTEMKLTTDEQGHLAWTWGNVKGKTRKTVLKMFDEGFDSKAIMSELKISKGYVSQIKNRAVRDGFLSAKGKLTQEGFSYLHE